MPTSSRTRCWARALSMYGHYPRAEQTVGGYAATASPAGEPSMVWVKPECQRRNWSARSALIRQRAEGRPVVRHDDDRGPQQRPDRAQRRRPGPCLLYTSDAADEEDSVDLGGRRIIKKKTK